MITAAEQQQEQIFISQELRYLIESYADHYLSSGATAQKIVERAKEENIPAPVIKLLVEQALESRGLSQRQIIRAIPKEFKDKKKSEYGKQGAKVRQLQADIMSAGNRLSFVKPKAPAGYAIPAISYVKIEPAMYFDLSGPIASMQSAYLRIQDGKVIAVLDKDQMRAIMGGEPQ